MTTFIKKISSLFKSKKLFKQYQNILENELMVSKTDLEGRITFANENFLRITGYKKSEVIGKTHKIIKSREVEPTIFDNLWTTIKDGRVWSSVLKGNTKTGEEFYTKVKVYPLKNEKGRNVEYMAVRYDVTDIMKLEQDIEITERELILALGSVGENRSGETGNHVKRVAEYSYVLACASGLEQNMCEILRIAAPMHDIGKVAIPDCILNKPGKLTDEEFECIKGHTNIGYEMFKNSPLEVLKVSGTIALEHHEKWDGSGYPQGLKGENISIYARIVTLADVFDALCSSRVYKEEWSIEKIDDFFISESGKHFDPLLIDIYFNNKKEFIKIQEKYKD